MLWYHLEGGHITRGGAEVTTNSILVLLLMGGIGGWYYGRMCAEDRRSEFDMEKNWNARKDYRQ
jgi:hypothetical protein